MSFFTTPRDSVVLEDNLGNSPEVGLFGSLKVAQPTTQISVLFSNPVDQARDTVNATTGLGNVANQVNRSLLEVSSSGIGTASATSASVLRYQTASTIETYFTASFVGTPTGSDKMLAGLFDDEDGVFLGYIGTDFVCGYRNIQKDGGTEPDVTQVIDTTGITLTNIHRFRIKFGYLGVGNISYECFNGTTWVLLHTFQTDASLTDRTHIGSTILPMRFEVSSVSGASLLMYSGSWNAQTYDKVTANQERPHFNQGSRTVSPTALGAPVVGFRSKTSFGGYLNKIRSQLVSAEFATGSEGLSRINFYGYPAGTLTTGTWEDVSPNSPLEVNDTLTKIPSALDTVLFSTSLAVPSSGTGVNSVLLDFERLGLLAKPGEEFLITKQEIISGGGDDITTWSIAYTDLI